MVEYHIAARNNNVEVLDCGYLFEGLVNLRPDYKGYRHAYRMINQFFEKDIILCFANMSKDAVDDCRIDRAENKRSDCSKGIIVLTTRRMARTFRGGLNLGWAP